MQNLQYTRWHNNEGRKINSMESSASTGQRLLTSVERIGNKLPDPAVLFIALLLIVWIVSWLVSYLEFDVIDPRTGAALVVQNQLSGSAMTAFFASMVKNFAHFHPIGVVLVAILGIGVAEHTGFINAALRALLGVTARWLLTSMIIFVGISVIPPLMPVMCWLSLWEGLSSMPPGAIHWPA